MCLTLTDKLDIFLIRQWLLEMDIVSLTQEEVCIKSPTLFARDWVSKNLKSQILSALEEVLGHPVNHLKIEVPQNSGILPMSGLVEGGPPNSSPSTSFQDTCKGGIHSMPKEEKRDVIPSSKLLSVMMSSHQDRSLFYA